MFTPKQVSERLNVSLSKTYKLLETKELAHHRIGGALRISAGQLEQYLEATKRERGESPARPKQPRPRLKHIKL